MADKNPRVKNVNLLIEFALNDSEGDNSCPERTESSHSMDMEDPSDEVAGPSLFMIGQVLAILMMPIAGCSVYPPAAMSRVVL